MQQYVTSGISSLGLGNRRFSLSRQESSEHQQQSASAPVQLSTSITPCPTPNIQSNVSGNIFNVVASTVGSAPGQTAGTNYPTGGVVIGNPNATNPLLGKANIII